MKTESKIKLVKLKTLEQLKSELKPISNNWYEWENGEIEIEYNELDWYINEEMLSNFGNYIRVEKEEEEYDYTHWGVDDNCSYHELWFEKDEFIKEEEMKI